MSEFTMYIGDTSPPYNPTLEYDSGAPINLSALSNSDITIKLQSIDNPNTVVAGTGSMTITNAASGIISYQWATADTTLAQDRYYVWIILVWPTGPQHLDPDILNLVAAP